MSELLTETPEYSVNAWGITFCVYGKAEPAGSKRIGRAKGSGKPIVLDANKNAAGWKQQVATVAGTLMGGRHPFAGPLYLRVTFYKERPKSHTTKHGLAKGAPKHPVYKPDTTKLLRGVEDALNGIVWKDDCQVVDQFARKRYGSPERVEIQVGVIA